MSEARPAASKRSRHCDSVAAVTPSSRESASNSSPRSSLSTASLFRREEKRPRSVRDPLRPFNPCAELVMDTSSAGAACPNQVSKKTVDREMTSDERAELVRLRRANRTLEMENEILKRAAALFARENVLPK